MKVIFNVKLRRDDELYWQLLYLVDGLYRMYSPDEYSGITNMARNTRIPSFRFDKKWFDECVYLPFENTTIPLPKEYDKALKVQFGYVPKLYTVIDWKSESCKRVTQTCCGFMI